MSETQKDPETGLPLLGGGVNTKKVPIDPKLLPELRDLETKMTESETLARDFGYNFVLALGTAASIGMQAGLTRKNWADYVRKTAALMGINPEAIKETDPENGLLILK